MEEKPRLWRAVRRHVAVRFPIEFGGRDPVTRRYGLHLVPTTIILDTHGREIDRIVGYGGERWYLDRLEAIERGDTVERKVAAWYAGTGRDPVKAATLALQGGLRRRLSRRRVSGIVMDRMDARNDE